MKKQQSYKITRAESVNTGIQVSFSTPSGWIKRKYYKILQNRDEVIEQAKDEGWQPGDFDECEKLEEF